MKKRLAGVAAVLVALLLLASPASAVQYGQPDGNGHPNVGVIAFYDGSLRPLWTCTGTLISPREVLTAGHCTGSNGIVAPQYAMVWFDSGLSYPLPAGHSGVPKPNPSWTGQLTRPDTHDAGVVLLDQAVTDITPATVAPAGYLDDLATRRGVQNTLFTIVGYGMQSIKPVVQAIPMRVVGTVSLINLRSTFTDGYSVHFSGDPGLGNGPGGICFGDSGGPVFHQNVVGQDVIVAVNSFVVNGNCKGGAYGYRVDQTAVLDFLATYR